MEEKPITRFMKAGLLDIIWDRNRNGVERNLLSIILQFRKYPYTTDEVKAGFMPSKIEFDLRTYMKLAAKYNHIELAKSFINMGASDLEMSLCIAAGYGHLDMVKLFISKNTDSLVRALRCAISKKHIDCVSYIADMCSIMEIRFAIDMYNYIEYTEFVQLLQHKISERIAIM